MTSLTIRLAQRTSQRYNENHTQDLTNESLQNRDCARIFTGSMRGEKKSRLACADAVYIPLAQDGRLRQQRVRVSGRVAVPPSPGGARHPCVGSKASLGPFGGLAPCTDFCDDSYGMWSHDVFTAWLSMWHVICAGALQCSWVLLYMTFRPPLIVDGPGSTSKSCCWIILFPHCPVCPLLPHLISLNSNTAHCTRESKSSS